MGRLAGVDTLGSEDGSKLSLVLSEPGDGSDGAGQVGESDGIVLPDDELLLRGELGAGEGQGGEGEESSYVLHHLAEI